MGDEVAFLPQALTCQQKNCIGLHSDIKLVFRARIMTKSKTYIPAAQPRTSPTTGLEDYIYWWKNIAKEQVANTSQEKKPFRRGRIWA